MGGARETDIGGNKGLGGKLNPFRVLPVAIFLLMACSTITADFSRVIAIQVNAPSQLTIVVGDTLVLEATAINAEGNPVPDAVIVWAILDVDSGQVGFTIEPNTGTVVGISAGSGRVRAQVEELPSDPITITVTPADTTAPDIRAIHARHPRADRQ